MSRARNVANPTQITIPVTVSANLTSNAAVTVGNTTVNSFISSSTLRVGNTSVNAFINSTAVFVPTEVDVGANVTLTTTGFSVGNSTVNTSITSTALTTVSNTVTIGTGTYFAANGRVGIGTSTPGNKLVISEPTSTSYQLNLNNSGGYSNGNYSGILFQQGASTETGWIRLNHQDNGDTSLSFGTRLTTVGERMRIDSSGNVRIGTTATLSTYRLATRTGNIVFEPADGNTDMQILLGMGSTTSGTSAGSGRKSIINVAFEGSNDNFYQGFGYVTTTANQTRINSAADFYIETKKAGDSSPTERARITSGGYFKASNSGSYYSSTGVYHELRTNTTSSVIVVASHSGSDPYGIYCGFSNDPNNATNYVFGAQLDAGTWIYRIYSNGTVAARSDAKWKKNIETARDGYAEDLAKLRVVKYNWYNHEDGTPKELGLIAQEVEEVFPGLVQTEEEIRNETRTREIPAVLDEEGNEVEPARTEEYTEKVHTGEYTKSIKFSVFTPMLIKAVQELKAITDAQTTRIEALEAKVNALENN